MINIYQRRTNTFSINSLNSKTSIPEPSLNYIFEWVDFYNYRIVLSLRESSQYPERYSTFVITDGSDCTFRASGEYNIYESAVDASVIDPSTMQLLENGQYTFFLISQEDYVYDPSLFTYSAVDSVFDPLFSSGVTPGPISINHDDLLNRDLPDNHPQYVKEASLGSAFVWDEGTIDVSVLSMDYAYIDGSLATRDSSIEDLYETKQDVIAAGTFVKESSLGPQFYWDGSSLMVTDVSGVTPDVTRVYVDGSLGFRDASIQDLYDYTMDLSTRVDNLPLDSSVSDLYDYVDDLSTYVYSHSHTQDASIQDLYDTKQDTIVDGTFVKEASIGDGLYWVDGQLDVSIVAMDYEYIDGSLATRDSSITDLYETALFGIAQGDASIHLLSLVAPDGKALVYHKGLSAGTNIVLTDQSTYIEISATQDSSVSDLYSNKVDVTKWNEEDYIASIVQQMGSSLSLYTMDTSTFYVNGIQVSGILDHIRLYNDVNEFILNKNRAETNAVIHYYDIDESTTDTSALITKGYASTMFTDVSYSLDLSTRIDSIDLSVNAHEASLNNTVDISTISEDIGTYFYTKDEVDASFALQTYALDLSTRIDNFSPDQDPSIEDLYDTKLDKEIPSTVYDPSYLNKFNLVEDDAGRFSVSNKIYNEDVADLNYINETKKIYDDVFYQHRPEYLLDVKGGVDGDNNGMSSLYLQGSDQGSGEYAQISLTATHYIDGVPTQNQIAVNPLYTNISQRIDYVTAAPNDLTDLSLIHKGYVDASFAKLAGENTFTEKNTFEDDFTLGTPASIQVPDVEVTTAAFIEDYCLPIVPGYVSNGTTYSFKLYAYKDIDGTNVYSANAPLINITDASNGNEFGIIYLEWTGIDGALIDGYKLEVVSDPQYPASDNYSLLIAKDQISLIIGSISDNLAVKGRTPSNDEYAAEDPVVVTPSSVNVDANTLLEVVDGSIHIPGFLTEASLGTDFVWNNGLLDVSVEGGSATQDASIQDLYNTKQDIIPDGTYVKEASLGTGLEWNAGMLDVSVDIPSADVTKAYVDGSLGARDTSIAWLNANKIEGVNPYNGGGDASGITYYLGVGGKYIYYYPIRDSSTTVSSTNGEGFLEINVSDYISRSDVDSSLGAIHDEIDASIADLYTVKVNTTLFDASILALANKDTAIDASIVILIAKDASIDASLNDVVDITSLFMREASLGTDFYWESGALEVSMGAISIPQDASIPDLYTVKVDRTLFDASLNALSSYPKAFQTLTIADASATWLMANGYNAKIILNVPTTQIKIPDVSNGDSGTIMFIQDASGGRKVTFPAGSRILYDSSTLTTLPNAIDMMSFIYDVSTFYWNLGKNFILR